MEQPIYENRREAGRRLAERVASEIAHPRPLILGLARGGVPVAFEVARLLDAELDVFVVRKLLAPANPQVALGALASGGVRVINQAAVLQSGATRDQIDEATDRELSELERREALYREGRPSVPVARRTVILVDDGLATGSSMQAAAQALREHSPERLIVAVPVASTASCERMRPYCDQLFCLESREDFASVSLGYREFPQVSDDEVRGLLDSALRQYAAR